MRRYWQFRKQIVSTEWRSSDGRPLPPVTLFDFSREIDCADASAVTGKYTDGWRISDDRVIGGFSTSSATLVRTADCWKRHCREQRPQGNEDSQQNNEQRLQANVEPQQNNERQLQANENSQQKNEESFSEETVFLATPYLRWYGRIDTTLGLGMKAQRSGFCAIQSPEFSFEGANLRGLYGGLEIQCRESTPLAETRSDKDAQNRTYTVNLKVSSVVPEDIYQGKLSLERSAYADSESSPFQTFILPFADFQLTAMGREREFNRSLDYLIKVESIGFVLMDGVNGDFQLDLARVRAVNCLDDGAVYEGVDYILK